jgi:alpha-beta hydrolase superfamily lysophospholipase
METIAIKSKDGTALRLGRWGEGERDVLIVHGLAEHASRYEHVGQALADRGFRVTVVELRGHGESGGRRGHVNSWQEYLDDMNAALDTLGDKVAVVGHSMGGLVVLSALASSTPPALLGVAVSNPLLGVRVQAPAIKIMAARMLATLLPWIPLSNELDTKKISRDPEVVAAYEKDPLVFSTITPRWWREMNDAMGAVAAFAPRASTKLHLLVSEGDAICDPDAARGIAAAWDGPAKVTEYGELYHELFNEPEKERVLQDLGGWLEGLF